MKVSKIDLRVESDELFKFLKERMGLKKISLLSLMFRELLEDEEFNSAVKRFLKDTCGGADVDLDDVKLDMMRFMASSVSFTCLMLGRSTGAEKTDAVWMDLNGTPLAEDDG
jgi:hypothetical protein